MIFSELFYPKELKETIADLHAKDDLNEEALKVLEHSPLVSVIIFGFVFILISLVEAFGLFEMFILALVCIGLGLGLTVLSIQTCWARMRAYLVGKVAEGVVIAVYQYVGLNPHVRVKVQSSEPSKRVILIGDYLEWHQSKYLCPKKGEKIIYFSNGKYLRNNVPDRLEIKRKYCLSKSMLNGAE